MVNPLLGRYSEPRDNKILRAMTDALQGQLSDGVLANLVQYLAMNQVTGCLTLRHIKGMQGYLFFKKGNVVHISMGMPGKQGVLKDVAALSLLMTWDEGRFSFRDEVQSPVHSLTEGIDNLLLLAAKELDETRLNQAPSFDTTTILQVNDRSKEGSLSLLSMAAFKLLHHLDGVKPLGRIAAERDMPLSAVLEAVEELHRYALIEEKVQLVDIAHIQELTRLMVSFMGPVGEIIVEDCLYDLNLAKQTVPKTALLDLVQELKQQLKKEDWQRKFEQQARALVKQIDIKW